MDNRNKRLRTDSETGEDDPSQKYIRQLGPNDPEFSGISNGVFGPIGSNPPSRTTSMRSSSASLSPPEMLLRAGPLDQPITFSSSPAMSPLASVSAASSPASVFPMDAAPAARSNALMRLTEGEPYATFDDSQYGEEEHSQPITVEDRRELSSDSSEDDGLPDIADIFNDELTNTDGTPIKETVTLAITRLTELATKVARFSIMVAERIRDMGDNIIADTKLRRKQQAAAEATNRIQIANQKLAAMKEKSKEITTIGVLRMIELETLIENIMDDVIPASIRDVPALLVLPVLEIVCHYEEYFGWETPISEIKVNRAFSEFRNKQRIRDAVLRLYGKNITLNEIIDELFRLYNSNFNTLADIRGLSLSVNGRVRVLKSIHTEAPRTEIATIPDNNRKSKELPVLSAIDYSTIWDKYAEPQAIVDEAMVELRNPVPAAPDNTPTAAARPFGYNDRHVDIAAHVGLARFGPPLTRAMQERDIGSQGNEDIGSQDSTISEFPSAKDYEHIEKEYPEYPEERFEFLAGERRYIGHNLSENVESRLAEYAARRDRKSQPTQKTSRMAELATDRMNVANNLIALVQDVQKEFETGLFSNMPPEEKQQAWERQIHRIFIQWYKETEGLEEQRAALDRPAAKAAPSSGFFGFFGKGGKKSHKKQKKQQKKQTRKTGGKRSTRKLQKKNHKKRAGHTKKH